MVGFENHILKFDALSTLSYCAIMCIVYRMKTNCRLHNKKIHPTDINASIMVMVAGSTEDTKSNYKQNVAYIAETDWNICNTTVLRQKKSVNMSSVTETFFI
jgi:hypothetical protein